MGLPDVVARPPPTDGIVLDPIHLRILHLLEADGRAPVSQMARTVGLTDNAVRYRLRRLHQAGVVRKFTVHVDPARLDHTTTAVVLLRLSDDADIAALRGLPRVALCICTAGPYQAMLVVVAKGTPDLERWLREDLGRMSGVIASTVLPAMDCGELPVQPSACLGNGSGRSAYPPA